MRLGGVISRKAGGQGSGTVQVQCRMMALVTEFSSMRLYVKTKRKTRRRQPFLLLQVVVKAFAPAVFWSKFWCCHLDNGHIFCSDEGKTNQHLTTGRHALLESNLAYVHPLDFYDLV